jgi:CRISPR type III-B/RAMP module-associated protein Cmr5
MTRNKSLDLATKCIEALKAVFGDQTDVLEGFRSRAREATAQLYYSGLPYAVTYMAAKASKERARGGGWVSGSVLMEQALREADLKALFERWKSEGVVKDTAYELYGACIMRALRELANLDVTDFLALLNKLNSPETQAVAGAAVSEFAEWLKRLAEAAVP